MEVVVLRLIYSVRSRCNWFSSSFTWSSLNALTSTSATFASFSLTMMYAFDVHCNSFFPMFVLLYVIHYLLSPLLVAHGVIPVLLSNLLLMNGRKLVFVPEMIKEIW